MDKLIIIAGATASAKTATAVKIAKRMNGEIISCDSMQIYRKMDIGTAKVTQKEMDGIAHHMIDIVDYDQNFTVAQYSQQTKSIISQIIAKGKQPILCGGTGLYIDSVIYPFSFGASGSENSCIKENLYKRLELEGAIKLHEELQKIDPEDAKKIHPNNTKRLIRALEIFYSTGKSKTQLSDKTLQYDTQLIVLDWQRDQLYERINKRVDIMFDSNILDEVKTLAPTIDCFNYQSMQAIGYSEFKDYLFGDLDINTVKDNIKQNSRHYAKRQLTWFKKYEFAKWLSPSEAIIFFDDHKLT